MMLEDFIGTLLQEETDVTSTNYGLLPTLPPSVNLSHSYHHPSTTTITSNNPSYHTHSPAPHHLSNSLKSARTQRGHTTSTSHPTCQNCDKVGHIAKDFYHTTNLNSYPTKHTNSSCRQRCQSQNTEAFFASSSTIVDPFWYLDSGAKHIVTNQLHNLSLHSDYFGEDKLIVGNGMTLS